MSGADLEYQAQLARAGQTSGVGMDGARLSQLEDLADTAWQNLPLSSNWQLGSSGRASYRRSNGKVELRGTVKATPFVGRGAFSLPAGYRPLVAIYLSTLCWRDGAVVPVPVELDINTDGTIWIDWTGADVNPANLNDLFLDNLSFSLT